MGRMTDAEKAAFFSLLREKGAALMGVADLRGIVAGELQLGVSVAIPVPAEIVRDLQCKPRQRLRTWRPMRP